MTNGKDYTILKTVGLFNDSFPPVMDGVALAVQNYARWINNKNVPVCVVTPDYPDTEEQPYLVYRYISMPLYRRKPYRIGLPELDFKIKSQLDKIDFGIIHAHCPFSSGSLGHKIAKDNNVPFVATFHSKFRDDFERAVYNKRLANQMVKKVINFFEKADEVWIPQASVEETIREYGFKGKVEVVDNGNDFVTDQAILPIKNNAREKFGIPNDKLVFLFVGQHIWEKNTRLILETLAKIDDIDFKMFFVGTGYAREGLKTLANELNLTEKVSFEGSVVDREKLKEYYAVADLFLLPSLYDNAPLVIREAAALHTPSVMVQGSTAASIISNDYNGFLIENSIASFSDKLRDLSKKREIIETVGETASKTIARSWENVIDEVLDRYKHLIERKEKK